MKKKSVRRIKSVSNVSSFFVHTPKRWFTIFVLLFLLETIAVFVENVPTQLFLMNWTFGTQENCDLLHSLHFAVPVLNCMTICSYLYAVLFRIIFTRTCFKLQYLSKYSLYSNGYFLKNWKVTHACIWLEQSFWKLLFFRASNLTTSSHFDE